MHYFKRNIGDYHTKCGRLSMLEHGAYTLLMDACYDREEFPTLEQAIDWCWARTDEEIAAVKFVLSRYFDLENGVYTQQRIAEELAKYREKADKNRAIALAREEAKRTKRDKESTKRANRTTKRSPSEHESTPNQEPLTKNQEPINISPNGDTSTAVAVNTPDCPHDKIIELYHERCPTMRRVKVWNDTRKKSLRTRWRENPKHQTLEFWERFFDYANQSEFLRGDAKDWSADLEWLIRPTNFAKVVEGKYENGGAREH